MSIAAGLEALYSKRGTMRLLMGLHDVDHEIVEAASLTQHDQLMAGFRARILDGVSTLRGELERNRVQTVAWMMRDGLLEMKAVTPRIEGGLHGIFHNKRLMFVDRNGEMVTATGSVNETAAGLGGNFEELTVHTSWGSPEYTKAHASRFEAVWEGQDERLATLPIDPGFAKDILLALRGGSQVPIASSRGSEVVAKVLTRSPFLAALNCSLAALFPHQERVVKAVCSRWPIRAILADEVGLGKTYEAAAVVSFALRHAGVSRVVVLTPPTLMRQWQDEFYAAFGLAFWRYESATRTYVCADGRSRAARAGPFKGEYPELTIVSRDLARGTRRTGHAFAEAELLPEMLIIDEAHAVRKRRTATEIRTSLVGRLATDLLARVPHALLLTATPLQVDASELFDALEILGVPSDFDEASYLDSLGLLSIPPDGTPELSQAAEAVRILSASVETYGLHGPAIPAEAAGIISDRTSGQIGFKTAREAQRSWGSVHEALLRSHPAATLCVRNTRGTLSQLGYKFPEREFTEVDCSGDQQVATVLARVDEYLTGNLGVVESVLYPGRQSALGFVRSVYRQRAASSLTAIQASLQRRLGRLRDMQTGFPTVDDFVEEDLLDEDSTPSNGLLHAVDEAELRRACGIEIADIEVLLSLLGQLDPVVNQADPKIRGALQVLNRFRERGERALLFSRYTDTVRALVNRYREDAGPRVNYAVYTGDGGLLSVGGEETRGGKELVTEALKAGKIDVVFCSDAASEGLNLQAASGLINVDVPWNPARLEQRIGRIARLGQVADSVRIVNLWYPRSVEAKIYARVLHRKDVMELALGSFPEIVGTAIRNAVSRKEPDGIDVDLVQALNERREAIELEALTRLWAAWAKGGDSVGSADLRREISEVLSEIAQSAEQEPTSWVEPVEDPLLGPTFTLQPRWIGWLAGVPLKPPDPSIEGQLGVLSRGGELLTFAMKQGDWVKGLTPSAIPDVLRALYLGRRPDLRKHVFVEVLEGQPLRSEGGGVDWWPDPTAMTVPMGQPGAFPPLPMWARAEEPWSFVPIQG